MSDKDNIIGFPHSRVSGANASRKAKIVGYTDLLKSISPNGKGGIGHWCSECDGVWFGTRTETECPGCGNRQG